MGKGRHRGMTKYHMDKHLPVCSQMPLLVRQTRIRGARGGGAEKGTTLTFCGCALYIFHTSWKRWIQPISSCNVMNAVLWSTSVVSIASVRKRKSFASGGQT